MPKKSEHNGKKRRINPSVPGKNNIIFWCPEYTASKLSNKEHSSLFLYSTGFAPSHSQHFNLGTRLNQLLHWSSPGHNGAGPSPTVSDSQTYHACVNLAVRVHSLCALFQEGRIEVFTAMRVKTGYKTILLNSCHNKPTNCVFGGKDTM